MANIRSDPKLEEKLVKVGGHFEDKKFVKLIKGSGLFIDRFPFFFSAIDPIDQESLDSDLVFFKLKDAEEAKAMVKAKNRIQSTGKKIYFANDPALFQSFRTRSLNVELMNSITSNPEFQSALKEYSANHHDLENRKVLIPETAVISSGQSSEVIMKAYLANKKVARSG